MLLIDILEYNISYYPALYLAIYIGFTLPATFCSVDNYTFYNTKILYIFIF